MPTIIPSTGARYFSKIFGDNHAAPAFQYLWDSTVVWQNLNGQLITGAARPIVPTDLAANVSISGLSLSVGAVNLTGTNVVTLTGITPVIITNTGPLTVSGFFTPIWTGSPNVTASVTIGNVAVTGGQIIAIVSGFNPIWVTGTFSSTSATTAITGNPGITVTGFNSNITVSVSNTTEQALLLTSNQLLSGISGVLTPNLTSAAWVTGSGTQLGSLDITHNYLPVSGVGTFTTNLSNASLNVAATGVLTNQITGWNTGMRVRIEPVSATTTSSLSPSGIYPFTGTSTFTFGQALAANPNRIMLFVQNIHTGTPLYVSLSSTAASTGAFSFILNPSAAQGWGGSSFSDDHYRGAVQVSGGAWQAWEI